jgi:hypothetical protein
VCVCVCVCVWWWWCVCVWYAWCWALADPIMLRLQMKELQMFREVRDAKLPRFLHQHARAARPPSITQSRTALGGRRCARVLKRSARLWKRSTQKRQICLRRCARACVRVRHARVFVCDTPRHDACLTGSAGRKRHHVSVVAQRGAGTTAARTACHTLAAVGEQHANHSGGVIARREMGSALCAVCVRCSCSIVARPPTR